MIDHQKQYTRIQASLFTPSAAEKNRLVHRIAQLQQQMTEASPALPVQRVEKMTCDVSQTDDQYGAVVRQMQKAIRAGEIFQVVPSRRFTALPVAARSLRRAEKEQLKPVHVLHAGQRIHVARRLAGKLAEIRRHQPSD